MVGPGKRRDRRRVLFNERRLDGCYTRGGLISHHVWRPGAIRSNNTCPHTCRPDCPVALVIAMLPCWLPAVTTTIQNQPRRLKSGANAAPAAAQASATASQESPESPEAAEGTPPARPRLLQLQISPREPGRHSGFTRRPR